MNSSIMGIASGQCRHHR